MKNTALLLAWMNVMITERRFDEAYVQEWTEGIEELTAHIQPFTPEWAAGITDLLQTAVSTGTGRAAQIGRPVAGKTGTTSSNKDGWFIGFSSGVTTGVWMGRDDAKAVPGLK